MKHIFIVDKLIFLTEKDVDGGYYATAIGQSIFTEADTIEALNLNIAEAIACHFDGPVFPTFKLLFA